MSQFLSCDLRFETLQMWRLYFVTGAGLLGPSVQRLAYNAPTIRFSSGDRDGPHQLDSKPDLISEIFCPRILVREGAEDDPKKTT